jgi:peroxiredoxin
VKTVLLCAFLCLSGACHAAAQAKPALSADEQSIADRLRGLRQVPDEARGGVTRELAQKIRRLPATGNKLALAEGLANLATEGDFGRQTLQEVATTLAEALREQGIANREDEPAPPYLTLAQLVRYEHVQVSLDAPPFAAALAKLEALDRQRDAADFALSDLSGQEWKLSALRGKVVLVNFWATWCPPCRKEMPDLEALYNRFKEQGFVILAISDEELEKVKPFIGEQNITYPVMLDPGRKVNEIFGVEGIPKSFVYNREGKLVAQSIDMRTQKQFLSMLAQAGLQ